MNTLSNQQPFTGSSQTNQVNSYNQLNQPQITPNQLLTLKNSPWTERLHGTPEMYPIDNYFTVDISQGTPQKKKTLFQNVLMLNTENMVVFNIKPKVTGSCYIELVRPPSGTELDHQRVPFIIGSNEKGNSQKFFIPTFKFVKGVYGDQGNFHFKMTDLPRENNDRDMVFWVINFQDKADGRIFSWLSAPFVFWSKPKDSKDPENKSDKKRKQETDATPHKKGKIETSFESHVEISSTESAIEWYDSFHDVNYNVIEHLYSDSFSAYTSDCWSFDPLHVPDLLHKDLFHESMDSMSRLTEISVEL